MQFIKLWLNGVAILSLIVASNVSVAGDFVEIVRVEGIVTSSDASGANRVVVATKSVLPSSNILATGANGRAVVRVGNIAFVVLEKNSKIEFSNVQNHGGFFRQLTGLIYYAVNSVKPGQASLQVKTQTATLGIRGTRFLVADVSGRNEVGMRKGTVNVQSLDGDFEIHKKAAQEEFDAYKREAQEALDEEKRQFEEYKADAQRESIEYKSEFALGGGRMASFDGKRVDDRPLGGETKKNMESAEEYASEWLKEVRD